MTFPLEQQVNAKSFQYGCGPSPIRKMFTLGIEMKQKYGAENVFDFSLGNPVLEPPESFNKALKETIENKPPMSHGYMPNQGAVATREKSAELTTKTQKVQVNKESILMTVGAAGAMNIVMHSILSDGDEVIVFAPFFGEYKFYTLICNGVLKVAKTTDDFQMDLEHLKTILSDKTRAVIINSPNNPTGVIYPQESVNKLGEILLEQSNKNGRPIYLISDEPYARILFKDQTHHSTFQAYKYSFVGTSFSKDLSVPGERIGFLAINPEMDHHQDIFDVCVFWSRVLGFVNAPALIQRVVAKCMDDTVDISEYQTRMEIIYNALIEIGYECVKPSGAFYLFPKIPGNISDEKFIEKCLEHNLIVVGGSGMGCPGYFRICYAISVDSIKRSIPVFKKVFEECQ
ncbi:Aminotransferase [Entamoeba marina]